MSTTYYIERELSDGKAVVIELERKLSTKSMADSECRRLCQENPNSRYRVCAEMVTSYSSPWREHEPILTN